MNIHLRPLPETDRGYITQGYCQTPKLPDEACKELRRHPWNRPGLRQIVATLCNVPCATVRQLEGLTGLPADLIQAELLAAARSTVHTRVVAPIGDIIFPEAGIVPDELRPFIPAEEQWAILPQASARLRKMAMVPTEMPLLKKRENAHSQPDRNSLATSGGTFVPVQSLLHSELTSHLARNLTLGLQPANPFHILHGALLRQAFGWRPLTPARAGQIRAGSPLWQVPHDCIGHAPPSLLYRVAPPVSPVVPMDLPDAWLVLMAALREPCVQTDECTGIESTATHLVVGIRIQVEVRGKRPEAYRDLFQQLPPGQSVLYLAPRPAIQARIRKVAADFPQVSVPALEWEEGGLCFDPTELTRLVNYASIQKLAPFPLSANLYMAADDAVYDLYRVPAAQVGVTPHPAKPQPSPPRAP